MPRASLIKELQLQFVNVHVLRVRRHHSYKQDIDSCSSLPTPESWPPAFLDIYDLRNLEGNSATMLQSKFPELLSLIQPATSSYNFTLVDWLRGNPPPVNRGPGCLVPEKMLFMDTLSLFL